MRAPRLNLSGGRRALCGRDALERLDAPHLLPGNLDGILARKASEAQVVAWMFESLDQALDAEVPQATRADERRDFFDRAPVRDELVARLHVDAEEARGADRRASDPEVDLLRSARLPENADDLLDRRPADDRVVDEHDALSFHRRPDGVQLEEHGNFAVRGLGHDERALDVPVLDEALDYRETARAGISLGLRPAGP